MESLPTLLLATAYAPPVSYFVKLYEHAAGTIALEGCEHYIKQSYRNRCRILGPNGVQSLTIPVELPAGRRLRYARCVSQIMGSGDTCIRRHCARLMGQVRSLNSMQMN